MKIHRLVCSLLLAWLNCFPVAADELKTATLQWVAHPKAKEYELQISDDFDFKKIVYWKTTNETKIRVNVPPGTYYYRVRGIETSGLKGGWSVQQGFTVNEDSGKYFEDSIAERDSEGGRNRRLGLTVFARAGQAFGFHKVSDRDLSLNQSENGAGFDTGLQVRFQRDLGANRKVRVDFHSLWRRQISNSEPDWLNRTRISGAYLFRINSRIYLGPRLRAGIKSAVASFGGFDPSDNLVIYRERFNRTELRVGVMASYVPAAFHSFSAFADLGIDMGGNGILGFPKSNLDLSSRFGWNLGFEYIRNLGRSFHVGADLTVNQESFGWSAVSNGTSSFRNTWINISAKFGFSF